MEIVHLHVHSCFSLMNGCGTIDKLISYAKSQNFKSLAITDTATCSSYFDFQLICEKNGIKPIFGVDFCVVKNYQSEIEEIDKENKTRDEVEEEKRKTKEFDSLVLIAKNEAGLKNLFNLVSEANINGFVGIPRVDLELIEKNKDGLICICGGLNSKISKFFINYKLKKDDNELSNAIKYAKKLKSIFNDDFYLEINITEVPIHSEINKFFLRLSQKIEVPFVICNNAFYPSEDYFNAYDMIQKIKNKETINSRRDLSSILRHQWLFNLQDFERLWDKYCSSIDKKYLYDGLQRTNEVANKCNVRIDMESKKSPTFILPEDEEDNREYLKKLAYSGLNRRFEKIFDDREKYKKQLEYELNVVNDMGYTDYFLIVGDFINWAKKDGILVGSGRGCFLPGNRVLSSQGRTSNIENLFIGRKVITHDRTKQKILNKFIYDVNNEICFRIILENGNKIECTYDHKIMTKNGWTEAQYLSINDILVGPKSNIKEEMKIECKLCKNLFSKPIKSVLRKTVVKNPGEFTCITCFNKLVAKTEDGKLQRKFGGLSNKKPESRKKNSDSIKYKLLNDAGFIKKISDGIKKAYENPQYKINLSNGLKKAYEKDPSIIERCTRCNEYEIWTEKDLEYKNDLLHNEFKIKNIEKFYYTGKVYDIEVENSHNYVVSGVSVHNSAAGCLLSYCLRITEVDPIKYKLLFERFLNKDRGGDFIVFELPEYDVSKYSECDIDPNKIVKKINEFCLEKLNKLGKNDKHHLSRLEYEIKNIGFRKLEKYIFNVYRNKKDKVDNKPNSLIWYLLGVCSGDDPFNKEPKTKIFGKSPDIDTDFQDDKRETVRDYLIEKWGVDSVASIVAYARYSSNNLFRDVCRVYDIDFTEVNKVAKFIETVGEELGTFKPFAENVKEQPMLQNFLKKYEHFDIQNIIEKIEGQTKHVSIAAAGSVISSGRLADMMSLRVREGRGNKKDTVRGKNNGHHVMVHDKERVLTEWEGSKLSTAGYLKIDLLGLRNLTIMKSTLDMIGKSIEYLYNEIPMDCDEVYEKLCKGDTEGVFQLEGEQITRLLMEVKPKDLEELAIVISLYRPAVLSAGLASDYVKRKYGKQKVIYKYDPKGGNDRTVYLPEIFESVVSETNGVVIYQEQLIEVFHKLGLTYGEADLLRAAMSNLKQDKIDYYIGLIKKRKITNIDDEQLNYIIDYMKKISGYSFNKSHAISYAFNSYFCQYLKIKYPLQFCLSNVNAWAGREDKTEMYVRMLKKESNCDLVLGDINTISPDFKEISCDENGRYKVVFGAETIKGLGKSAILEISKRHDYKSFIDFLLSGLDTKAVSKRSMVPIIEIGYFNNFQFINKELLDEIKEKFPNTNLQRYDQYLTNEKKLTRGQLCHIFEGSKAFRGKDRKYFYKYILEKDSKNTFDFQMKIFEVIKDYLRTIEFNIKKSNKKKFFDFIIGIDVKYHDELNKEFDALGKNYQKYLIDIESRGQTEIKYVGFNCFSKFKLNEKQKKIYDYHKRSYVVKFNKIGKYKNKYTPYTSIGVIKDINQFLDKNNNKMARIDFNDMYYNNGEGKKINIVVFSDIFKNVQKYFKNEDLILFNANLEGDSYILDNMKPIEMLEDITEDKINNLIETENRMKKEKAYGKNSTIKN